MNSNKDKSSTIGKKIFSAIMWVILAGWIAALASVSGCSLPQEEIIPQQDLV